MANLKTATSKYAKVVDQVAGFRDQCDEFAELVETKKAKMSKVILNGGNFEKLTDELLKLERKHELMIEHLSLAEKHQDAAALVLAEIVDKNARKVADEAYGFAVAIAINISRQISILATKEKDLAEIQQTISDQGHRYLDNSGSPNFGRINNIMAARSQLDQAKQTWQMIADRFEQFNQ